MKIRLFARIKMKVNRRRMFVSVKFSQNYPSIILTTYPCQGHGVGRGKYFRFWLRKTKTGKMQTRGFNLIIHEPVGDINNTTSIISSLRFILMLLTDCFLLKDKKSFTRKKWRSIYTLSVNSIVNLNRANSLLITTSRRWPFSESSNIACLLITEWCPESAERH